MTLVFTMCAFERGPPKQRFEFGNIWYRILTLNSYTVESIFLEIFLNLWYCNHMTYLENKIYIHVCHSRKVSYQFIHVYKVYNKLKINLYIFVEWRVEWVSFFSWGWSMLWKRTMKFYFLDVCSLQLTEWFLSNLFPSPRKLPVWH